MASTNPDNNTTSSITQSFSISFAFAFVVFWLFVILFINKNSLSTITFNIILWVLLPIISYLLASTVNIINQSIVCGKSDAGMAFLGGLPTLGTVYIGMFISMFSICRIPVVSAVAPMLTKTTIDIISKSNKNNSNNNSNININSNSGNNSRNTNSINKCCPKRVTLETIEKEIPSLQGIAYGFYVLFSMMFGNVIGTGLSINC
jgi:hypothetical protein